MLTTRLEKFIPQLYGPSTGNEASLAVVYLLRVRICKFLSKCSVILGAEIVF